MSIRRTLTALAIVAVVGGPTTPAPAAPDVRILGTDTGIAIQGHYIVALRETGPVRTAGVAATASTLTDTYRARLRSVYTRTITGFSAEMSETDAIRLAADPNVAYVEQDQTWRVRDTQETPPWGLDRIDQRQRPADNTYSYEPSLTQVNVYVIDTGIRITHTDFGGRASHGWDFVDNEANAGDCQGHGTKVAGIAGGATFGVAKNVKLVAVRAFDCNGIATQSSLLDAVEWVTSHAVKPAVVNLSVGPDCKDGSGHPAPCPPDSQASVKTAITNSIAAGISYVAAAGNQNIDSCGDPFLKVTGVIGVGASTFNDTKDSGSNWGSCIDLWAPGTFIQTADRGSDTATAVDSGTSFAVPHVTGAIALMMTRPGPAKTPAELKAQLLAEATQGVLTGLPSGSHNRLLYVPPPPVAGGSSVALAPHQNGRLVLFGVNPGGTLFYRSQTQANSDSWSPWRPSVDPDWYSVCAEIDSAEKLKLVGLRRGQHVFHRGQAFANSDSWTIWRQFDGLLNSCAVASAGSKLNVFGTNALGQVWRRSEVTAQGPYTPWAQLGGVPVMRSVAAERNGNGLVELFGLDRTGLIWHCWDTANNCPAGAWHQLDGQLSTIALARNKNGALTVFGSNASGQMFQRTAGAGTNTWSAWQALDVPPAVGALRSLAAETNADGRITLVGVTTNRQVWQRKQTATNATAYGPWAQLDGQLRP